MRQSRRGVGLRSLQGARQGLFRAGSRDAAMTQHRKRRHNQRHQVDSSCGSKPSDRRVAFNTKEIPELLETVAEPASSARGRGRAGPAAQCTNAGQKGGSPGEERTSQHRTDPGCGGGPMPHQPSRLPDARPHRLSPPVPANPHRSATRSPPKPAAPPRPAPFSPLPPTPRRDSALRHNAPLSQRGTAHSLTPHNPAPSSTS